MCLREDDRSPTFTDRIHLFLVCGTIFLFFFCLPYTALSDEMIIADVVVNHERRGEFFMVLTDEGDFLVRMEDLKEMGFRDGMEGRMVTIEGESYMSLRSIKGVSFSLDEEAIALSIVADPMLLRLHVVDMGAKRVERVFRPEHPAAFLNYGLVYTHDDRADSETFTLTNQLGIRHRGWLFLTDTSYTRNDTDEKFSRLSTSLTHDNRENMTRLVLGDFIGSSGGLGGSLMLGGVRFAKVFQINPYFIRQPKLNIRGFLTTPSDVEVYMDNVLISRERLSPGEFELRNIYQTVGSRTVEVVIRDAFGVERRLRYPYYFTDSVLGKGLHEYSYAAGFKREDFGLESFSYGKPAITGFHRYGFTDFLTAGLSGELSEGFVNLGVDVSRVSPRAGLVTVRVRGSSTDGRGGGAGSLGYSYVRENKSASLSMSAYTEDYQNISSLNGTPLGVRYEIGGGVNYGTTRQGVISMNINSVRYHSGSERREYAVRYSRTLGREFILFTRLKRVEAGVDTNEFFIGLNYYPTGKDVYVNTGYTKETSGENARVQIQNRMPVGEGYGWRLFFERDETPSVTTNRIEPSLQVNADHGIYRIDQTFEDSTTGDRNYTRLSFSGSVLGVGGRVGLSRPVRGSFGLVRIDRLKDVPVYVNSQLMGRTDEDGYLFVPTLASYIDNQISIKVRDLPMDYYVPEVMKYVSPSLMGGFCLDFGVRKIQLLTGRLFMETDDKREPMKYKEVVMVLPEGEVLFDTGGDGEFYMDNFRQEEKTMEEDERRCVFTEDDDLRLLKQGVHTVRLLFKEGECEALIDVPASEEMFVEVGDVVCRNVRLTEAPQPAEEMREEEKQVAATTMETETDAEEEVPPSIGPAVGPPSMTPPAPAAREQTARPQKEAEKVASLSIVIHFDFDRYSLRETELERIERFARVLKGIEFRRIDVKGYTCDIGTEEYNQRLAIRRAISVKKALEESGIPARLINIMGMGECCYVSVVRALNRRVEIRVIR